MLVSTINNTYCQLQSNSILWDTVSRHYLELRLIFQENIMAKWDEINTVNNKNYSIKQPAPNAQFRMPLLLLTQ